MLTSQTQHAVQPRSLPLEFLQAAVRRLMPSWRDALDDFCYLEGGYSNANYQFRHGEKQYVLRTPLPISLLADPKDSVATNGASTASGLIAEMQLRSQLPPKSALNIAPLVAADLAAGRMITAFVSGPVLAEQLPTAVEAARFLRHLHVQLQTVERVERYALAEQIERWMPTPPDWLSRYLASTDDMRRLEQASMQCCHNDLNPWNLIRSHMEPSRWTSLDWETAKLAHPVFDAVCLHQGIALAKAQQQTPDTNLQRLDVASPGWISLADFCAQSLAAPVPGWLLLAALRSFWLREYAWAVGQRREGNANPAIAVQLERAEQQLRMHLVSIQAGL